MPEKNASNVDIFSLLSEDSPEEAKKKRRKELLEPTGVKELFKEGNISVNKYTCVRRAMQVMHQSLPNQRALLGRRRNRSNRGPVRLLRRLRAELHG